MSGGLNRLLASVVLAGAFFVLPHAALADCGSNPSAVNVYSECKSTGGGGQPTGHSQPKGSTSGGSTSPTPVSSSTVHISKQTTRKLKKAGSDGQSLSNLLKDSAPPRMLSGSTAPATAPTAVGSAFDLGSGPTALIIVLAGSAVLLFAATGYRSVRQRRD